jgi:predicted nucleic acid-binding Zn ribbon protein
MKKKKKRFVLKIYWYGALLLVFVSLFQKYKEKFTK